MKFDETYHIGRLEFLVNAISKCIKRHNLFVWKWSRLLKQFPHVDLASLHYIVSILRLIRFLFVATVLLVKFGLNGHQMRSSRTKLGNELLGALLAGQIIVHPENDLLETLQHRQDRQR